MKSFRKLYKLERNVIKLQRNVIKLQRNVTKLQRNVIEIHETFSYVPKFYISKLANLKTCKLANLQIYN